MATGINIMFDPEDDGKKTIGIRYPVRRGQDQRDLMGTMGMKNDRAPRTDRMKLLLNNQNEFLLVNTEDYPLGSYPISGDTGFKLKIGLQKDYLAYELRVPLIPYMDFDHFVNSNEDGKLLVNVSSVEMKKPEGRKKTGAEGGRSGGMGGGRAGGRSGGKGGSRPGGMSGGRPGGTDRTAMEPISFEISLELAK